MILSVGRTVCGVSVGLIARSALVAAFIYVAVTTSGFVSVPSLVATLDGASLLGLIAIAMTLLTLSGNILSLALGASLAVSAMVFLAATPWGAGTAIVLAIAAGAVVTGLQGVAIGMFRANSIIVSIAALAMITGIGTQLTGGIGIGASPGFNLSVFSANLGPFNVLIAAFVLVTVCAQLLLSFTRFGRELLFVGSNAVAARAAGIRAGRVVVLAYVAAGVITGIAGILAAARFQTASLEMGFGYNYDAIAAVLIGGTAIHGGQGSAAQTFLGAVILSAIHTILVLHGYSQEMQRLLTGVLIVIAVALQRSEARQ